MGEIAAQAGVSRQAVYLHFTNRLELLTAVVDWVNKRVGLSGRAAWIDQAGSSQDMLRRFLKVLVWLVEQTRPGILALHSAIDADPALTEGWLSRSGRINQVVRVVAALRDEGQLRRDLSAAEAAAVLRAVTRPIVIADLLKAGLSQTRATTILYRTAQAAICEPDTH